MLAVEWWFRSAMGISVIPTAHAGIFLNKEMNVMSYSTCNSDGTVNWRTPIIDSAGRATYYYGICIAVVWWLRSACGIIPYGYDFPTQAFLNHYPNENRVGHNYANNWNGKASNHGVLQRLFGG